MLCRNFEDQEMQHEVTTQRLGAERVRHLKVRDLWISEKVSSYKFKISQVKSEDNRADLLTKYLDPERHHKLITLLPLRVPGTKREVAKISSVGAARN